jgi:diguanylate cyclase (GGDEF)-like protein/PAS domain S-box-containing protein
MIKIPARGNLLRRAARARPAPSATQPALPTEELMHELQKRQVVLETRVEGLRRGLLLPATAREGSEGAGSMAPADASAMQMNEHLRAVAHYSRSLIESSLDPLIAVSTAGTIMDVNAATEVFTGVARDRLVGSDFAGYFTEPEKVRAVCELVLRKGNVISFPLAIRHASGSVADVLYNASVLRDENGEVTGLLAATRDITELKRYQVQLEHQSNYDALTALPNRNLLTERLSWAVAGCLREGKKLAVLVLNLDRFREVNDGMGRGAGDCVLQETAARLGRLVQGAHTLARTGADEFTLIGEVREAEEAADLARRMLDLLARPFRTDAKDVFLFASVGISVLPKDSDNGDTLLKSAVAAMYRIKATGGNNFLFYSAEINAHALERLDLVNDLHRAIERDELLLHCQPQVNIGTGAIVGVEALVRWQHPKRGL